MSAGNQQRNEREARRVPGEQGREQVAFQVMHGDGGNAQTESQAVRDTGAHQQGAGQARPRRVGDAVKIGRGAVCPREYLAQQGQQASDMVPGRQLRDDPAIRFVQIDLGVQGVGAQAARRVEQSDAGFVAGRFDAENQHVEAKLVWYDNGPPGRSAQGNRPGRSQDGGLGEPKQMGAVVVGGGGDEASALSRPCA